MANHKSAEKRNLQNIKRRSRNRTVKTRIKTAEKKISLAEKQGDASTIREDLIAAQSTIDKASKKGVIHKRTAARKISRLSKRASRIAAS